LHISLACHIITTKYDTTIKPITQLVYNKAIPQKQIERGVEHEREYGTESVAKGWTSSSNINPYCIKALKTLDKESGKRIAEFRDKIIYDAEGKAICCSYYKEQKTYQLES
jgi:hypothetical protein